MHRILQILSETCHFSNAETALLLCLLLLQENTNSNACSLLSSIVQVSFLITSRKHSFISSVLNLKKSHIYMLPGKTESGADQKLAHGLSLSPSVFPSLSSLLQQEQSLKEQDDGLLFDASTTAKRQINNTTYEIFFISPLITQIDINY